MHTFHFLSHKEFSQETCTRHLFALHFHSLDLNSWPFGPMALVGRIVGMHHTFNGVYIIISFIDCFLLCSTLRKCVL